jgi:hypothetical protein
VSRRYKRGLLDLIEAVLIIEPYSPEELRLKDDRFAHGAVRMVLLHPSYYPVGGTRPAESAECLIPPERLMSLSVELYGIARELGWGYTGLPLVGRQAIPADIGL